MMPLILTGARQVGKSSLLATALAAWPAGRVAGLCSQWHWEDGRATIRLAPWNRPAAARRVAWREDLTAPWQLEAGGFDRQAGIWLRAAARGADLVVVDELGLVELTCARFVAAVRTRVARGSALWLVIQERAWPAWRAAVPALGRGRVVVLRPAQRAVAAEACAEWLRAVPRA